LKVAGDINVTGKLYEGSRKVISGYNFYYNTASVSCSTQQWNQNRCSDVNTVNLQCTSPLGGGCDCNGLPIIYSGPYDYSQNNGWTCKCAMQPGSYTLTVYAVCANVK
jgi:hypothetical protein